MLTPAAVNARPTGAFRKTLSTRAAASRACSSAVRRSVMSFADANDIPWIKSSYSANGANCVEVGKLDGHQKRIPATVVRFPFYDPEKTRPRA